MDEPEVRPAHESIRSQLRAIRQARRLSLTQLAELMTHFGSDIGRASLGNYENGDGIIRLDDALAMALALRVPLAQLVLDEDDPNDISLGSAGVVSGQNLWRYLMSPVPPDQALNDTDAVTYLVKRFQPPLEVKEKEEKEDN